MSVDNSLNLGMAPGTLVSEDTLTIRTEMWTFETDMVKLHIPITKTFEHKKIA